MSVLVLIREESEVPVFVRLGASFAAALDTDLVLAVLGPENGVAEPILVSEIRSERGIDVVTLASIKEITSEVSLDESRVRLSSLCKKKYLGQVIELSKKSNTSLLVLGYHDSSVISSEVARQVFSEVPCDTILLRSSREADAKDLTKVLVPVCGGPHSIVALAVAEKLARFTAGQLTALYVETRADEIYKEVGKRRLEYFLQKAGLEKAEHIKFRVELSDNIQAAISKVAQEDFDLILIGATRVGAIRRSLFGTLPRKLLAGSDGILLGAFRRQKPILARIRDRLEDFFDLIIPQLERGERISLFEEIEVKSRWNFDFFLLIAVSTAIAALGLIQNSGAVVIGAMLVAPLMTPLLGMGLSLLQENIPLLKSSSHAVIYGFIVAFFCGAMVGHLAPASELTVQMLARTSPSILDIIVGFLSGLAAAHCIARPGLSAALPGVAIAAALVPPIATSGIALSLGQFSHTLGAMLLFFTNVVAIILGASSSFFGGGIRPKSGAENNKSWPFGASVFLLVVAFALSFYFFLHPRLHSRDLPLSLAGRIERDLSQIAGQIEQADVTRGELGKLKVNILISAMKPPNYLLTSKILERLAKGLDSEVELELRTELVLSLESHGESAQ